MRSITQHLRGQIQKSYYLLFFPRRPLPVRAHFVSHAQAMFHGRLRQLYPRPMAKCHLAPAPGCPSPQPGPQPQLMYMPRRTTGIPRLYAEVPPALCGSNALKTSWVEVFMPFPLILLMLTTHRGKKSSRRLTETAVSVTSQE